MTTISNTAQQLFSPAQLRDLPYYEIADDMWYELGDILRGIGCSHDEFAAFFIPRLSCDDLGDLFKVPASSSAPKSAAAEAKRLAGSKPIINSAAIERVLLSANFYYTPLAALEVTP